MSDTNGAAQSRLDKATERVRLLQSELQAKQLERAAQVMEAAAGDTVMADFVNAYSSLLDRFRGEPFPGSLSSNIYDRRYGKNFPFYQNEQELALLRGPSRIVSSTNSYGIGLREGLTSYVVGDGFSYRATLQDDQEPELADAVQDIIDAHLKRNQWHGEDGVQPIEEELFGRGMEDGEWALLHFADEEGWTTIRTGEPEQMRQPPGSTFQEYGFGIRCDKDDAQTRLSYYFQWGDSLSDGTEYPPEKVIHYRCNTKRSIKRGLPDFTFDVYDALTLGSKLRRNMQTGAAIQAALAAVREHDSAQQVNVQAFADLVANFQATNLATGVTQNQQRFDPGTILDIPKGYKYVPPPMYDSAAAGSFTEILHAGLRGAGVRWNAPEWLATASGADMAAYTASLTQESPFVRTVLRKQRPFKEALKSSVWIAVRNRIRGLGGLLRIVKKKETSAGVVEVSEKEYTLRDVERLIDIQVEAPSPIVQNALDEAQANAVRRQGGWKSIQTIQQEEGLDPDREAANMEEWEERFGSPGLPLPLPGEETARNGTAPPGALESRMLEAWDESQHNRGQPDNAGQFGPGGAAGGQAKKKSSTEPADSDLAAQIKSTKKPKEAIQLIADHSRKLVAAEKARVREALPGLTEQALNEVKPAWVRSMPDTKRELRRLANQYTIEYGSHVNQQFEIMKSENAFSATRAKMIEGVKGIGDQFDKAWDAAQDDDALYEAVQEDFGGPLYDAIHKADTPEEARERVKKVAGDDFLDRVKTGETGWEDDLLDGVTDWLAPKINSAMDTILKRFGKMLASGKSAK